MVPSLIIKPFRAALEEKLLLCNFFHNEIRKMGFRTGPEPDLSITLFRFPEDENSVFTQKLVDALHNDGRFFFSSTVINDQLWIRCAVVSFRTHFREIKLTLEKKICINEQCSVNYHRSYTYTKMGIKERKEREKQDLKDRILSTAAEIFRREGYEKTSMRAIADEIEYSQGTIYLYFKDKDELLYEVSVRGFDLFFEHLSSVSNIEDPMKRLKKMGEAYITFALEYSSYYDLMFIMNAPMRCVEEKESWEEGYKSHKALSDAIKACQEAGHFPGYDPGELSLMIWGQVHGIVSLYIRDRLDMYQLDDREQLLFKALAIFNNTLEKL